MPDQSIFISSLSRRELARRRPNRSPVRAQALFTLVMLVVIMGALGGFVAARGGI
jgi:hypothetical protein